MSDILSFASDYLEGMHPAILKRLTETNLVQTTGYGLDPFCDSAKEKIRAACNCPEAEIYFLVGGTQTNATVIDGLLAPYQGVIAAETGHISCHEAGAIEAGGHKVLTVPHTLGKISAEVIDKTVRTYMTDESRDHLVMPGMVYLSHPTEYGTLYTLEELTAIHDVCQKNRLYLYVDGARLAYSLASEVNDVFLPDLARLCDAFYIGGTKCGAMFGEAVVLTRKNLIPHFFTMIKQHGALLAKGRLLGLQFDTLFTDGLYETVGRDAVRFAGRIQSILLDNGYELPFLSPSNQVFVTLSDEKKAILNQTIQTCFWEKPNEEHTTVRLATSWATTEEMVEKLIAVLVDLR